ncbi:MAG: efflux RND transporter periplasmic adaptor subunit [Phycisphaerales bacterium]|nr:efflux RND transporter periplasmic adaptor subunit [Phycisphaerales bacterium]
MRMNGARAAWLLIVPAVVLTGVIGGCKRPPTAFTPPPPAEVTVAKPAKRMVPIALEYTGTVRGYEEVEVRARVRGFLEKKHVQDGKRVTKGELLFSIDPRTFEATLSRAKADQSAREADLRLAEVTLERTQQAGASNAVSKIEVDRAQAQRDAALAQVEQAKAVVRSAELDLEFTQIKAPISGRIGFVPVEVGDLVGATEPTLLARLINDEKVYATYDMEERTVLESRKANQNRRPGEDGRPNLVVRLGMSNEVGFPHEGYFDRADNAVNPQTGTIRVESIFENKDGTILPGAYVRVQPVYGEREAMTVPDVAVLLDQRGRYVLVVGAGNKVERRDVRVGEVVDRQRIIVEGLEESASVIVNGLQRARPGAEVRVSAPTPPASPTPAKADEPKPAAG